MGQIKVTPEQLRSQASQYGTASGDVKTILDNLSRLQGEIASEWEGQAFQAFDAQFAELKPKVIQFAELLVAINTQLNKAADSIESHDQQLSTVFGLN